MTSDHTRIH